MDTLTASPFGDDDDRWFGPDRASDGHWTIPDPFGDGRIDFILIMPEPTEGQAREQEPQRRQPFPERPTSPDQRSQEPTGREFWNWIEGEFGQ